VLDRIFSDRTFRFTAPVDRTAEHAEPVFLNFDQLYLEALLSGTKTTGALRTKVRVDRCGHHPRGGRAGAVRTGWRDWKWLTEAGGLGGWV